jgi:hypothetical protein
MVDDPEAKHEIAEATEDLRDALHQINNRVEEGVARLRPDRGIRKHPVTTACIAGALGFALGADSSEVSMLGLLLAGAVLLISREHHVDHPNGSEQV